MKNDQELLGSGAWYFVDVNIDVEKRARIVLDELEYKNMIDGLNKDGKFIRIGENHYFWSKIDCFGPLKFEKGVLEKLKEQTQEVQTFIKKRIRKGINVSTMEKLKTEISFFYE